MHRLTDLGSQGPPTRGATAGHCLETMKAFTAAKTSKQAKGSPPTGAKGSPAAAASGSGGAGAEGHDTEEAQRNNFEIGITDMSRRHRLTDRGSTGAPSLSEGADAGGNQSKSSLRLSSDASAASLAQVGVSPSCAHRPRVLPAPLPRAHR